MAVMAGPPIGSAAIDHHRRIPAPLVNSGFVTANAVIAITRRATEGPADTSTIHADDLFHL